MKLVLFLFFVLTLINLQAQPAKIVATNYQTSKIQLNSTIKIDGYLDDEAWKLVEWGSEFTQRQPFSGKTPSQKTAFKIMYDDNFLYVAIKAYDTAPDSIGRRLTRRDDLDGDLVGIAIDSYNDKMTCFNFLVNAAGVKADGLTTNDGDNEDYTPDYVWYAKTSIDKEGWNAEFKIPLTQLRFNSQAEQVWGIQIARFLFRKEELSIWQYIPREASGWVHHFGSLTGLNNLKPKRQVEVLPYLVAKTERFAKEEGNPYMTGKSNNTEFGLDGKIGLTNDFTLDFTINPDFGQVEADPSQVNLTAFESYFAEKRPFFIEGRSIMSYQLVPGDGDLGSDNIFYSRRIGRSPQYYPDLRQDANGNTIEYEKRPENSNILFASKITGKTRNGFSVGILESVTNEMRSKLFYQGTERSQIVEPMTNYFVGRIQKDFNKGETQLGYIFSATNRKLNDANLKFLHKSAYSTGIDLRHTWKNKTYFVNFKAYSSDVKGDTAAILRTQTSSARYYQRPDADYVRLDSNLTSLQGYGGAFQIGKGGNGNLLYMFNVTWRSPGLELNDIGYEQSADQVLQFIWVGYKIHKPFGLFRSMNFNFNQWTVLDFGGNLTEKGGNVGFNTQLKNFWYFSTGFSLDGKGLSNSSLRGGPTTKTTGGFNNWISLMTDEKKKLKFSIQAMNYVGNQKDMHQQNINGSVSYRPNNAISFSVTPDFTITKRNFQYVDVFAYQGTNRYVFGELHQKNLSLAIRASLNITTDLTIQFYGEPFISSAKYVNYKYITNPTADNYNDRFHLYTNNEISVNSVCTIDENQDRKTDYSFDKQDYNYRAFRSNLVLRWEYTPGSVVYLVWAQNTVNDHFDNGDFKLGQEFNRMFDNKGHHVFLLKFSYRIKN